MIKVLFDHQIFSLQIYGGISRYFANLINEIVEHNELEAINGALYSKNYYFQKDSFTFREHLYRFFAKKKKDLYYKNLPYAKFLLKKGDFDVFHPTYFDPYFLPFIKKPFVITIYDMIYEIFPHFFPEDAPIPAQKKLVAEGADRIIAISETTRQDIIKYLNVDPNKITVIYHGIDTDIPEYTVIKNLPKRYLLFVGSRGGYKNFLHFARAFKKITETDGTIHMVIAGGGALNDDEVQFFHEHGITQKILHISATDAELNTLYKNALCFVFPSLYEGFGIPILEAFKNNCPVLLSNCSCFPEIAGDAALYFDVNSMDSLLHQLTLLMNNEEIRTNLVTAGKTKLQDYTLEKCTTATINLYKELGQLTKS